MPITQADGNCPRRFRAAAIMASIIAWGLSNMAVGMRSAVARIRSPAVTPILMLVPPKSTANAQGSEKLMVHTYATHPLESTQKRIHTHPFPRHAELLV